MAYFNIRYVSYTWPFVLVGAWSALLVERVRSSEVAVVAVVTALLVTPAFGYREDLEIRRRAAANPLQALYEQRSEFRALVGDEQLVAHSSTLQQRNFLAYVLRRPLEGVGDGALETSPEGALVVVSDGSFVEGEIEVGRFGDIRVVRV